MSFAEKAAKHKARDWKAIKYVKSERSEKTGNWRFNETIVQLAPNESLDQALARMKKEVEEMVKEMASIEDAAHDAKVSDPEKTEEVKVVEEKAEAVEEKKEKPKVEKTKADEAEVKTETEKPEVEDKKEESYIPFEDVAEQLREETLNQMRLDGYNEAVEDLEMKYEVKLIEKESTEDETEKSIDNN